MSFDSLNPAIAPQFRPPLSFAQLVTLPGFDTLRQAAEVLEPRVYAVPDDTNVAVAARATFDMQITVPPGARLLGFSASSAQPEGFRFQVSDAGTREMFFSRPVLFSNASGQVAVNGVSCAIQHLPAPRIVLEPGLLNVQISNLSAAVNDIQLLLHFAVPVYSDATLMAEEDLIRRALRNKPAGAGISGPAAPSGPAPWDVMPAGGRPFNFEESVNCPAPNSSDFLVLSFRVPIGYAAAIRSLANVYTAAGFDEGSGDLIWRLSVDGAYMPGFDNIRTTLGSPQQPRKLEGAILAGSGQLVEYKVSVAAGVTFPTGAGSKIFCHLSGWFYAQA